MQPLPFLTVVPLKRKMKTLKYLLVVFCILFSFATNAQNILSCEVPKNLSKIDVFELKDTTNNIIAKIQQHKRDYLISFDNHQYLIKKGSKGQLVFYDSIFTDTIAVIKNRSITLGKKEVYSIRPEKSGWKIREGKDIELKVKYIPEKKIYLIKVYTPAYNENIINLLAGYYAIRKCKEILQSTNSMIFITSTQFIIF